MIAAGVVVVMVVLSWADTQRARLDPPPGSDPSARSGWFDVAFLAIVLVPLGLVAAVTFGGLKWIMAIVAALIVIAAVAPLWRDRGLEALFGKRNDASDEPMSRR
jgi:nitrate reductase NapE component